MKKRIFTTNAMHNFTDELKKTDWKSCFEPNVHNPELAYANFLELYSSCYNKCFPLKAIKIRKKDVARKEWMTPGLIKCCHTKLILFRKWKQNPNIINEKVYKKYNKILSKLLRSTEKLFYNKKILNCNNDSKQIWSVLNSLISKKKHDTTNSSLFSIDGKDVSDRKVIAEKLNDFFVNIGSSLAKKIPNGSTTFDSYLTNPHRNSFVMYPTDAGEIIQITHSLKNKTSSGFDEISVSTMKSSIEYVAIPLSAIFNMSLESGYVPNMLKIAKVCPIYKGGAKGDLGN
jgi:hypothetical protein